MVSLSLSLVRCKYWLGKGVYVLVPWGLEEGIEFVVVVEVERWSCVGGE